MTVTRCCYDLSHHNPLEGETYEDDIPLFQQAYDAGWIACIHKLTEGSDYVDPVAVGRLQAASKVTGKLLGGYHFLSLWSEPSAQVANFMSTADSVGVPLLLVLDFETDPSRAAERMASEFVDEIYKIRGVWPVLYTGRWTPVPIPQDNLPLCPLWLAEYGTQPIPPAGWPDWVLHQYSDGVVGPSPEVIPGIGAVDQSEFAGTADEMRAWWVKQIAPPAPAAASAVSPRDPVAPRFPGA